MYYHWDIRLRQIIQEAKVEVTIISFNLEVIMMEKKWMTWITSPNTGANPFKYD